MDERLFARLATRLIQEPLILASVLETRGATPRKTGARMLIGAETCEFSVGGGEAEARVVAAARELLRAGYEQSTLEIDLSGGAGAAGICGGHMQIALRRWQADDDLELAQGIAATLSAGSVAELPGFVIGFGAADAMLQPDVRLLTIGAGHCGLALYDLARHLDFELWLFDQRPGCFEGDPCPQARVLCGEPELLRQALDTPRAVFAVLLTRDFQRDLDALAVLAEAPPAFIGMMGSRRRVAQVRAALPPGAAELPITAPIGIELAAQTPHEIAVGILAQLIAERSALSTKEKAP